MLINAHNPEELRIAVMDGSILENYQVQVRERGLTRGNIYRGVIANVQPSLNAAFIDYGMEKHGFLAIQDVVSEAYYHEPRGGGRPRIDQVLDKGRPIVVQVVKEPEGKKGAALTTALSLPGRYLVLTPFDQTRGISRKVEDDDTRQRLREIAKKLDLPEGCGFIVRTNALDQNKAALNRDLNALLRLWKQIAGEARKARGTKLLYSDQDLIMRALRDHVTSDIKEVLIDDDKAFAQAQRHLRAYMPRTRTRLTRYADRTPIFSRFNLEQQIDRIYEREVGLPSGGSLVIDRTEALTAIDVNSGKATKASSQEETAVATNVEAASEVARQLRLRDIGGLVVVDFIDMRSSKNQRQVEKTLREAMKADKARSTVGRTSSNGLVEINRQRIQQDLLTRTHRACPTCAGTGRIASPEMVGLNLLRRIEARAATGHLAKVRIALHPELADAFQNMRRAEIAALEREFELKVEIIASNRLHRPEQEIDWFERDKPLSDVARRAMPEPPQKSEDKKPSGNAPDQDRNQEKKPDKKPRRRSRGRRRPKAKAQESDTTSPVSDGE
jgi:ribonuclease E